MVARKTIRLPSRVTKVRIPVKITVTREVKVQREVRVKRTGR